MFSEAAEEVEPKKNVGVTVVKNHDHLEATGDLFNVDEFLLHCCLDDVGIKGIQKAFYVTSHDSSGSCTLDELYKVNCCCFDNQIEHFNLHILPETCRISREDSKSDPYTYVYIFS